MENERFVDLIQKKKEGKTLSGEEIRHMITSYVAGNIPDYQMSAMLMAICFCGMDDDELIALTMAMRDSGDIVDLSSIPGIKVDKHSTGGVGDKTTLIVGPIVAACNIPVAKMSGRGLGFTGGTLDKLESIPGFRTSLDENEFFHAVKENGISIMGQTANLAPADKLLYALRDVTATVESIPLIAASIMSKKLAAGSDKIVLDVTTGSGAFIHDTNEARELAKRMVAIGSGAGKETVAILTSMDEPLGEAVGNNLEVIEAIQTLQNKGPKDVIEVCLALAGMMISLGSSDKKLSYECGKQMAKEVLESEQAFEKFKDMVQQQGGDVHYLENTAAFEKAAFSKEITSPSDGYIVSMDTASIGVASGILGAGRETKESIIDFSAGIRMKKKIGDFVKTGDTIAICYTSQKEKIELAASRLLSAIQIEDTQPEPVKLVVDIIR